MIRCLFLCLFFLLHNLCCAQLADNWIAEAVSGNFNAATHLIWDTSGHLIFLAHDEHRNAQVFRIDPLSNIYVQLTDDTISKTALSVNHANGKLLLTSLMSGDRKVIQYDLRTSEAVPLIPRKIQQQQANFNVQGNMAAFIGKEENERYWNLYTYDFVYNNLNKLSLENADHEYPMWSPNAELLSFESRKPDERHTKLIVIHWYGKLHLEIADSEYHIKQASWSPNNQWIAYVMENYAGSKLMICRKNGTDKTIIYESSRKISYPVWSATGSSIAFMLSDDIGQTTIYQLIQQ